MKNYLLIFCFLSLLLIFLFPCISFAAGNPNAGQPLVPCNGPNCTISSFFIMLDRIYTFIVWDIAGPLAIIALTIGGIMMMISAGNPGLMGTGKNIFWTAVIGLVLVFCSWLIIDFVLKAIGFTGNWSNI